MSHATMNHDTIKRAALARHPRHKLEDVIDDAACSITNVEQHFQFSIDYVELAFLNSKNSRRPKVPFETATSFLIKKH
jgi:hypothetical protein